MSFVAFPDRIDARRLFDREGSISSEIPSDKFQRLNAILREHEGPVEAHLSFDRDEYDRRRIRGTLSTGVTLTCQRCLGDLRQELQTELDVRVVSSDEEARVVPGEVEPVIADAEGVDLLGLVEDELILSLPTVPQHEDVNCNEVLAELNAESAQGAGRESNPFAKLRELKLNEHPQEDPQEEQQQDKEQHQDNDPKQKH